MSNITVTLLIRFLCYKNVNYVQQFHAFSRLKQRYKYKQQSTWPASHGYELSVPSFYKLLLKGRKSRSDSPEIQTAVCHFQVPRQTEGKKVFLVSIPVSLLSSKLLSKNLKIKIYKTIILPVILYGCETWSLTRREERKLRVF